MWIHLLLFFLLLFVRINRKPRYSQGHMRWNHNEESVLESVALSQNLTHLGTIFHTPSPMLTKQAIKLSGVRLSSFCMLRQAVPDTWLIHQGKCMAKQHDDLIILNYTYTLSVFKNSSGLFYNNPNTSIWTKHRYYWNKVLLKSWANITELMLWDTETSCSCPTRSSDDRAPVTTYQ